MVTHPTTNSPACGLSTAERTGSPVFHTLWSYVSFYLSEIIIKCKMILITFAHLPVTHDVLSIGYPVNKSNWCMLFEGFPMYSERKSGSSELPGWRNAV